MAQTAPYKPAPITQRDGSPLANSNCRMASAAVGLDYDTLGAKTSTGAKMRSYTSDQSGGTDSGDAKEAWSNGYDESLSVRDGGTFDDALAALNEGRLVHLDVWAASVGKVCLSGSGAYGHTIAVLPDQNDDGWLVSDPWCSPPKWARVSTQRLKDGAEEWGRRVYGETGGVTDHPVVRRAVKSLMSRSYPGHVRDIPPVAETSGPKRILFTVTAAHASASEEDMGDTFLSDHQHVIGDAVTTKEVGLIPTAGGGYYTLAAGYAREVIDVVTISSGKYDGSKAYLTKIPGREEMGLLLADYATYTPRPTSDGDAATRRDAEWEHALKYGEPWPTESVSG